MDIWEGLSKWLLLAGPDRAFVFNYLGETEPSQAACNSPQNIVPDFLTSHPRPDSFRSGAGI